MSERPACLSGYEGEHLSPTRRGNLPQPASTAGPPATIERRPKHGRTCVFVALPQPRHAVSAAADAAASHRASGAPVLPIEDARTHAPDISTGVVAVFPAFQHPTRRVMPRRSVGRTLSHFSLFIEIIWLMESTQRFIYPRIWRARLASRRRLAQWFGSVGSRARGPGVESRRRHFECEMFLPSDEES